MRQATAGDVIEKEVIHSHNLALWSKICMKFFNAIADALQWILHLCCVLTLHAVADLTSKKS